MTLKQEIKFNDNDVSVIRKKYLSMTLEKKHKDIIIWPETALPSLYHENKKFFRETIELVGPQTSILSGVFRYDESSSKIF